MEKVTIFDTTLRDGEQAPGFSMNQDEKLRLARQLAKLNVDVIEAGFPAASDGDYDAVRKMAAGIKGRTVSVLVPASEDDIDRAARAVERTERPRLHTFLPTSDIGMERILGSSRVEVLDRAAAAVRRCRGHVADVQFTAEDATRSNWSYLAEVFSAAVNAGARTLGVADTFGYATPEEIYQLIGFLFIHVRNAGTVTFSVHCHDDLGLAVANSLAGLQAGCRQVECTVNGIGERAGNAALEEIVMALEVRPELYLFESAVKIRELCPTSRLLADLSGLAVPPNKAIVGAHALTEGFSFGPAGQVKGRDRREVMMPEMIGNCTG